MSCAGLHLGMFAKYWEPGLVKTRLAAALGDDVAARVYRQFVETLLTRCSQVGTSRELVFAPDGRGPEFRRFVAKHDGTWDVQPQGGGDLGAKMQRFFQRTLVSRQKVVLIGTDAPTIPLRFFEQTNDLLDRQPVVLGPSEDGGYYLVAAREIVPPIFSGIAWSTDQVWQQTIDKLEADGIRYATLPRWYDVDDESDLRRLCRETSNDAETDFRVAQLSQLFR